MDSLVKVRVHGPSGTIILQRPEKRNALTRLLSAGLVLGTPGGTGPRGRTDPGRPDPMGRRLGLRDGARVRLSA
jgi:hypothetical protein